MTTYQHAKLLAYSFITWLIFYLIGLPDYYQSWPFWGKVGICLVVTIGYFPGTRYALQKFWAGKNQFTNSLWLALYLTLPLFVYDYLLLAVYQELGISFVFPYWYLSIFYFSFWIQFPLIGWWLQLQHQKVA